MSRKHKALVAAGLVSLGCGAGWLTLRTAGPEDGPPEARAGRPGAGQPAPAPAVAPGPAPEPAAAAAAPTRNYLELYAGRSGVLPPDESPSGAERVPDVSVARSEGSISAAASRSYVVAGEKVAIKAAYLLRDQKAAAEHGHDVAVHLSPVLNLNQQITLPMARVPDSGADQFAVTVDTNARALRGLLPDLGDATPPLALQYQVVISRRSDGKELLRSATDVFTIARPGAALLPRTSRLMRQGEDLVLQQALDVDQPGRYWVYAELWTRGTETAPPRSIAFGRKLLGALPAGRHRATLLFGGLIIRDLGVDGPYEVRNVTLSRVDSRPPHLARRIDHSVVSAAWRAAEFGPDPGGVR